MLTKSVSASSMGSRIWTRSRTAFLEAVQTSRNASEWGPEVVRKHSGLGALMRGERREQNRMLSSIGYFYNNFRECSRRSTHFISSHYFLITGHSIIILHDMTLHYMTLKSFGSHWLDRLLNLDWLRLHQRKQEMNFITKLEVSRFHHSCPIFCKDVVWKKTDPGSYYSK